MHPVLNFRSVRRGLESITIGSLSLEPEFDNGVMEYEAHTPNASNKVTVVPVNEGAEVVIKNNGTVMNNGTSASWKTGANELCINVDGLEYKVNVIRG